MIINWGYEKVLRPLLFRCGGGDPERVHDTTLSLINFVGERPRLRSGVARLLAGHRDPVTVAGIDFPGRVGVAAGLDKNGLGLKAWGALGFGYAELGTVTAQGQPGNAAPRLFRLAEHGAILNRMGFNNLGAPALAARLAAAGVVRGNGAVGIPLGISLGKTRTTPLAEATTDYLSSFRLLAGYADYVAVNVSSPNTPGLRTLQDATALGELTSTLVAEADRLAGSSVPVPVFVKLAPDLSEDALEELLDVCLSTGVAGLIATNTTLARTGVEQHPYAAEAGGLSGAPLAARTRAVVSFLTARTSLPVIGVGGIMSADDGRALLDAGAVLLQVYTGYIYGGPALVRDLNQLTGRHG
ncbi:quinone-dependent dihydroorotate dehydrogenase [uncultured Friedmanniella sp.]|uniref:quinone-dependent dihydroorotate dehydrogenase n=1 Tax=uncultured Friedmanniella sp. TaxID=335381 RepID=UPI0035CC05AD